MSKPDFVASMIEFASGQPESVERAEAGSIKRWLGLADQALKVRDDEPDLHKTADTNMGKA
jgi:hypothetical protein